MNQNQLLVLVSWGIHFLTDLYTSGGPSKSYYFVNESKAFDEAQRYCRENHIDLVSVEDWTDVEQLLALEDFTTAAWIGLKKTPQLHWRWALADPQFYKDGETEYRNWGPGEPTNHPGEFCSVMDSLGKFRDTTCKEDRSFICYEPDLSGQKYSKHMLINQPKPWRDAQSYCRQQRSELVSVRNQQENLQIQQLIPTADVTYIGLFQDAFVWSDDSMSSFRNWDSGQPDGSGECVVHLQRNGRWDDQRCSDARPFFCYDRTMFRQILKLKVESDQNVNDPDTKAAILEEIKQKLVSQGISVRAHLQWKTQANGDVFQREEKTREK